MRVFIIIDESVELEMFPSSCLLCNMGVASVIWVWPSCSITITVHVVYF